VRRVGILLPARGRWKGYGIEARRGAELCLEDQSGSQSLRLEPVFREEAEGADPAAAIAELADRENAVAVVGPLLSASVERALPAAARRSLALISPTASGERLGEGSPVFFRTCMTMDAFASSLAGLAVRRAAGPAVAILTPAERYGRSFAAAFRRALEERGGRVLLVREYDPSLKDVSAWVAALKKELRPGLSRGPGGWAVDALFFAGTAEQAGMILPRLALQGMDPRELTVLGGSALNVPGFPRLAGGYGDGTIIADGFFSAGSLPAAQSFARRYRARHGVDPGAAAAQGCAAAEALAAALRGGAVSPGETLAALGGLGEIPSVIGRIRLFPGGRIERRPFVLTVKGGALVELEER